MRKAKKWLIRCIVIIVATLTLKMAFEILRIPNYKNGTAYVSYSPDGQYEAVDVYTETILIRLIRRQNDGSVILIQRMPRDFIAKIHTTWDCDDNQQNCVRFSRSYDYETRLPPTFWQRLHAWLTVKLKGLENPNLNVKKEN